MQVKYNKKASQHISSTIDYYLENFGTQATVNLAHEIDEKIKTLRKCLFTITQLKKERSFFVFFSVFCIFVGNYQNYPRLLT